MALQQRGLMIPDAERQKYQGADHLNAVIDSCEAHQTISKQVLDSERVQKGLLELLLRPGGLWEALREQGESARSAAKV